VLFVQVQHLLKWVVAQLVQEEHYGVEELVHGQTPQMHQPQHTLLEHLNLVALH
jgi:hypothetical protein